MWQFIQRLISFNDQMLNKVKATQIYDEALSFYSAKEYKKALPLMTEASNLGHPQAMSLLGTMYLMGFGVKENGKEAESWLLKSVEAGFSEAASVLGMAYATGKAGVKIDTEKATRLLTEAAEKGDQQSARMLTMMQNGEGMFASKPPRGSKLH